jgi:molybdopterin molybdotransferase
MPISYHEALRLIHTHVHPLHVKQTLPLLKALHRISSRDICAKMALPKYPMSLKEGYGIAFATDTTCYRLLTPPYPNPIPLGFGVKMCTGESVPEGINTIIPEEEVLIQTEDTIHIALHVNPFSHIKKEGEDSEKGDILLAKGERLSAQKITALASQGIQTLCVFKKPTVSLLSIGTQLVRGEIYNSNAISIAARIIELGGKIVDCAVCDDTQEAILTYLSTLSETSDFIITTGAMSCEDSMCRLLETRALHPLFHHVRLAPAKPSALSLFHSKPILHLPGLPLSCMLGFEMLGVPLLRHLQMHLPFLPSFISCINQKRITCKEDCVSAIPGRSDGSHFISAPHYEAGRLTILSQCNGYILSENRAIIEEGEEVSFFCFTYPPVS